MSRYLACHTCGLIHQIPNTPADRRAECTRCGSAFPLPGCRRISVRQAGGAGLSDIVLFTGAVHSTILEIEKFGIRQQSSILGGTIELLKHGNWLVGGVVLLFSVVFPLTKIVLLLELSLLEFLHKRHKATTLHIMEHVGKWSMMDVMLLAFLVMLAKLGNLVHFQFGPAIFAFILCVAMSMVASISFHPHAIWEDAE